MHLLWNVGNNSGILEDLKNDKGPERQQNIDHAQSIGEFDLILKYLFLKPPLAVYLCVGLLSVIRGLRPLLILTVSICIKFEKILKKKVK